MDTDDQAREQLRATIIFLMMSVFLETLWRRWQEARELQGIEQATYDREFWEMVEPKSTNVKPRPMRRWIRWVVVRVVRFGIMRRPESVLEIRDRLERAFRRRGPVEAAGIWREACQGTYLDLQKEQRS